MQIALNLERLNLSDTGNPFVKMMNDAVNQLSDVVGDTIELHYVDKYVRKPEAGDSETRLQFAQGINMLRNIRYRHLGVEYDLVFFENSRLDKNGKTIFMPKFYRYQGQITVDLKRDPVLAFFLVFACGKCKGDPRLKFHNENKSSSYFYLYDAIGIATKQASVNRLVAKVMSMIYDTDSGLSDKDIKILASHYKVQGVLTSTPDVVRQHLSSVILKKDGNNYNVPLIEDFIRNSNTELSMEVATVVQEATAKDIIRTVVPSAIGEKAKWVYKSGDTLMMFPSYKEPSVALIEHLLEVKSDYEKLKKALMNVLPNAVSDETDDMEGVVDAPERDVFTQIKKQKVTRGRG